MQLPLSDLQSSKRTLLLLNQIEFWISVHTRTLVWVAVIIGFYLRFQRASVSYLNGDETQIMFPICNTASSTFTRRDSFSRMVSFWALCCISWALWGILNYTCACRLFLRVHWLFFSILLGSWLILQRSRSCCCYYFVLCPPDGSFVGGSASLRGAYVMTCLFAVLHKESI